MSDYISREAAIKRINGICVTDDLHGMMIREGIEKAVKVIYRIPAADVAPVVHEGWRHSGGDEWCCTNCGNVIHTEGSWERPEQKYCEECGAKMNGGKQ